MSTCAPPTHTSLERRLPELRRAHATLSHANEYLRAVNATLVTANAELQQAQALLASANEQLGAANAVLLTENAELRRAQAVLTTANEEVGAANVRLVAENAELRRAEAVLGQANESLGDANAALLGENVERRQAEATLVQANEALQAVNAGLVAENASRREAEETLTRANEALRASHAALIAENAALRQLEPVLPHQTGSSNLFAAVAPASLLQPLRTVRTWARLLESTAGRTLGRPSRHLHRVGPTVKSRSADLIPGQLARRQLPTKRRAAARAIHVARRPRGPNSQSPPQRYCKATPIGRSRRRCASRCPCSHRA